MKKYKVTIDEILTREFNVTANNKEEALEIIKNRYDSCDIILDADDFIGKIIRETNGIYLTDIAHGLYCTFVTLEDFSHGEYESFILNNKFYSLERIENIMKKFLSNEKQNFEIITNMTYDFANHIFTIDDNIHGKHLKIEKMKLNI